MFEPTWQSAARPNSPSSAVKRPRPRRATSSRKTRSTGSSAQKARISSRVGSFNAGIGPRNFRLSPMPIHIRAEPGEYADACLLPGDPLRAKYIAETYFDNSVQRNGERGMLGYSGEWEGKHPALAVPLDGIVEVGLGDVLGAQRV